MSNDIHESASGIRYPESMYISHHPGWCPHQPEYAESPYFMRRENIFFSINGNSTTILLLMLCSLACKNLQAHDIPHISYLGIEHGLSNNSVTCIYQDKKGFMWFGTFDGLNRFDGYQFKVFRNRFNDTTSLSGNRIVAIHEDNYSNLWIGTKEGASIYNNMERGFRNAWYLPYNNRESRKLLTPVKDIKSDSAGNLFLATDGIGLLVSINGAVTTIQVPIEENGKLHTNYSVQGISVDSYQRVWLIVNGHGLYQYDRATKSVKAIDRTLLAVNCIAAGDDGKLWIGNNQGLFSYDMISKAWSAYNEQSGQLTSNRVINLFIMRNGNLWIATDGGGVDIFNVATKQFEYLSTGGRNGINSSAIYAVFEDRNQRKWIGTMRGGINITDAAISKFQLIKRDPLNDNSLVNDFVLSFSEDAVQNLWIGTDGGGLSYWDRKLNVYTNYSHRPHDPSSLSNNFVTSIYNDSYHQTWIATYGGGINRFIKATGKFERFDCINTRGGADNDVWVLYEDKATNLWAGTIAGALYLYNRNKNKFEVFDESLTNILTLVEDSKGILWAGNFGSLIRIDVQKKKHISYDIRKPVRCIQEGDDGNLWLATEGRGLLLFNTSTAAITQFTTENGLSNSSVLNILKDNKRNLWVSTFSGISTFNVPTRTFKNFDESDGLQSNQFNYNAAIRLHSGEFVFGGIRGFNIFYPDSVSNLQLSAVVTITGLRVNNQEVYAGSPFVKQADGNDFTALAIPFDHGNFSFDYAALEYSAPAKISYAYFLEGWDKQWIQSGKQRTANYSGLWEGNYTLRIRAINVDGSWLPSEIALKLTVLPPWYRSWWAYLAYVFSFILLLYMYRRYKTRRARLQYEIKIARLNAENEKQLSEKEREIAEKRLTFFTNISHEFRTPLTLIINPIRDLLKLQPAEGVDELKIVSRNASRLLSLVDQLLLFRKTESELETLRIIELRFIPLCREIYLYFVQEAKAKNITYTFECCDENIIVYGDREKIEIMLYNLVSNALKYTPVNGKVIFRVAESESSVDIRVIDSGIGIPSTEGRRVFDKFYQVQRHGGSSKTGFGIGLYMVNQFIEQHHGKIFYESRPGEGTIFSLILLKGKSHFGNQPILEVPPDKTSFEEILGSPVQPGRQENPVTPLLHDHKSMLVVDDNPEIRQYISQLFADQFAVYQAEHGEAGLEMTRKYFPDLVISDVVMPGMTGLEMCKMIKADVMTGHIPVILLTALGSEEMQLQGTELGADAYLTKPFTKEMLVAKVNNIIKSRSQLQHYFFDEITLKKNDAKVSAKYREFLEKCIASVEKHLDDDAFTIQVMAKEIGMSHSTVYKKIKSISGQSANGFIRFIRLRTAARLFLTTDDNVNEVAFQVGISDLKYFREQFAKLFGLNPSDYIKKYRHSFNRQYIMDEQLIKNKRKK